MVTRHEAVCLWEDFVGDSGHAPTDEELHAFALAIEAKARKPFIKLVGKWKRKAKELNSFGDNNAAGPPGDPGVVSNLAYAQASGYTAFAQKLKDRLDGGQ